MKIRKMNKKGYVFTTGLIVVLLVVGVLVILPLIAGGLAFPALDKIPTPVWIILGVILLFKLTGGKKK